MQSGRSVSVLKRGPTALHLCPIQPGELSPNSGKRRLGALRWGTPMKSKPARSRSTCRSQRDLPAISLDIEEKLPQPRTQNRDIKVPAFRKRLYKQLLQCRYSYAGERHWAKELVAHQTTRESRQRRSEGVCGRVQSSADACVGADEPLLL